MIILFNDCPITWKRTVEKELEGQGMSWARAKGIVVKNKTFNIFDPKYWHCEI